MTSNDKIVMVVAAAVAIAIFWGGCKYGENRILKQTGSDTTIYRDSIKIIYQPTPYKVERQTIVYKNGKPVIITVHDTLPPLIERITDPVDFVVRGRWDTTIIEAYFKTSYYHNEIDSGRIKVVSEDTVSQNRLIGKSLKVISVDTTIHTTTVLKPSKNFVVYYTLSTGGNFNNPLYQQGAGIAIKLPSDKVYQLEIKRVGNHRPMIEGRILFPIKFGKR